MSEIIVDSFAGGGGASEGIRRALGRDPDIAINHDDEALAMHAANHPATLHLPHNVWKVDPLAVTKGRPVGLLWASPDCRHHSKAKGGRPVSRSVRDLAWVVVRWAREVRPRVVILENVEEFRDWGPLTEDEKPCPERRGQTFERWQAELKRLGYKVEHRELRACDYGAPTIRKRLFVIARRDGRPIVWPEPTHGKPGSAEVVAGARKPWRTAAEIIDWQLACPSIFLTREEAKRQGLKVVRPLAEATMARIGRGVWRYVIHAAKPFIVTCNHQGPHFRGQGLDEPFVTVAAARDGHGLVAPVLVPRYGEREGQAPRCLPADASLPTVVPTGNGAGLVAAHLMTMRNAQKPFNGADEPAHTVTAGGAGLSLVASFLAQHNTDVVGHDAREPVSTIVGKGCTQGVVSAFLSHAQQGGRSRPADAPLHTVCASTKDQNQVVAAFLSQHMGDRVGTPADSPVPTVMTRGTQTHLVAAFLAKYYATATGQPADEPLHTATTKARFGVVTVAGVDHVIVDIGMRMLTARELARAQGFGDDYVLAAPWKGGTLTDTAQRRMIGNSVCPDLAHALVGANYVPDDAVAIRRPEALPLFAEAAA